MNYECYFVCHIYSIPSCVWEIFSKESRSIVVQGALVSLLGGHESLMTKLILKWAWAPSLIFLIAAMLHDGVWGEGRNGNWEWACRDKIKVALKKLNSHPQSRINITKMFLKYCLCCLNVFFLKFAKTSCLLVTCELFWPSLTRFHFAKAVARRQSLSDVPPDIRVSGPCIDQSDASITEMWPMRGWDLVTGSGILRVSTITLHTPSDG